MRAAVGLALVFGVAVTGCATSGPGLSFAVEQRLLRETTLDDAPAGMAAPGDNVVRVAAQGACSGALIGPHHVLTAEHCVVRRAHQELTTSVLGPGHVHVEFGADYLPWGRLGVRAVRACPGYELDPEHDVAVLILSHDAPSDVPVFPVTLSGVAPGDEVEVSGFGTRAAPRAVPFTEWPVTALTRHAHRGSVRDASSGLLLTDVPGRPGDSGGPIVASTPEGRLAVVGVTSKGGSDDVLGPTLSTCADTIRAALAE